MKTRIFAAALIGVCALFVFSGCSIIKRVGRTVRNIIAPVEYFTPAAHVTQHRSEENETPRSLVSDDLENTATPEAPAITPEAPAVTSEPTVSLRTDTALYYDIHDFHGEKNLRSVVPVSWQKGTSIIRSEIMPMDIGSALWTVGYNWGTEAVETDMNSDDNDEPMWIETDGETTLRGIYLTQEGTTVNLLGLISDGFWNAVSPIMDSNGTLPVDCVVEVDAMDLDDDGRKEIIIAMGDNNNVLAASVLAYTGGSALYQEVGGIIGQRLLYVTEEHTLYAAYGNPSDGKYVEFWYDRGQFELLGYNMD